VVNQVVNRPNGAGGAIMQQSPLFDALPAEWDDLTANVAISFPILGIKGGKWHYRFRGEEAIILDANGRFPTPAVQVVILKAQQELSRTFYAYGYVEGQNNPPDCWSSDGVAPDNTVAQPINPVCATCPNAAWGSGATPAAPKAQACQQRRRTVLVPYGADLTNGQDGPCLLSVPPGSLTNQVAYGNKLREWRVHYAGCVTELSFTQDPSIAFPKIEFNYVRPLTDDEARVIIDLRGQEQVDRILMTKMVAGETDPPAQVEQSAAPTPAAVKPAMPSRPQASPPAPPRPSMVKAPVQPAQQAAPPPPTPPQQQAAAPPPPPPNRAGGFGVSATPPRAPIQPQPQANSSIATAMAKPAAPPPSARPVLRTAPPAVVEPEADEHADAGEPATVEGMVPDELTAVFSDLMKNP
jgi:hypothetical protein